MSLLGFDAIGRRALGQNPSGTGALPAVYGGSFGIWPPALAPPVAAIDLSNRVQQRGFQDFVNAPGNPNQFFGNVFPWWPKAPRPVNFARDWIAFSGNSSVEFPVYTQPFSPFDLGRHARNSAVDWVAFAGNLGVDTLPISSVFSLFDPAPRPRNFARDWVAFSGDYFVQTTTLSFFTGFSLGQRSPNFAKDWIAYSGSEFVEDFPNFDIDYLPFAPGLTAKLWSQYGQQPQWWPYYFKPPIGPKRDRGGVDDWIPRHRHPSVYSKEYYDELRKRWEFEHPGEELPPEILPVAPPVPNLLIPLNRLIPPTVIPTLLQLPPYRPMPSLTTNPPPFRMATPEEMAADDELIIRMLLED